MRQVCHNLPITNQDPKPQTETLPPTGALMIQDLPELGCGLLALGRRRYARPRREAVELGVLSFVDDTHPTTAELFHNAIVRDVLRDHAGKTSFETDVRLRQEASQSRRMR